MLSRNKVVRDRVPEQRKQNVPISPVLSLPGSCYESMTNLVSKWLERLHEAQIETSSSKIRDLISSTDLDEGEVLIYLNVKSLYTNVPVVESIE